MTKRSFAMLSVLLSASITATTACGVERTSEDGSAVGSGSSGDVCEVDADCGAGLECEVEEEHGTITSFCKPHGGDGSGAGSGSGSGSGTPGTFECQTDADCGAGLECEIEDEHGTSWSYCKPHGS